MNNLVSSDWLAEHLNNENLVVLDASWTLPGMEPDGIGTFLKAHIPGARYFDIEDISDHNTDLPHMLPSPEYFARKVGELGISNNDTIIIYDTGGFSPAGRAWWMFRAMGHKNVAVLDGGIQKWAQSGHPLAAGPATPKPKSYSAAFDPGKVADRSDILKNIEDKTAIVLDARGPGRFTGVEAEPRPGMRSGHIPGARNFYYGSLLEKDGSFISDAALGTLVQEKGLKKEDAIITSCGSGVTASVLAHALDRLGFTNVRVYDGSWAEWGMDPALPLETGPEKN